MTALNPEALEAIARAICCPDGCCSKWNSCTWKDWIPEANAAAKALHASEPDAVAVERAEVERIGKLLNSYDAATAEPMVALANYGEIALQILREIRARSQP